MEKKPRQIVTELIPIDQVKPCLANERLHPQESLEILKNGVTEFDMQKAIVIDANNEIIAGHGIYAAMKEQGYTHINVQRSNLKGKKKKAFRVFDNKSAELSKWDDEKLSKTIYELHSEGYAVADYGFSFDEGQGSAVDETPPDDGSGYTKKIEPPIYEPKGEKPKMSDLYNTDKTQALIDEINNSNIPDDDKAFLCAAACRHTVFDYGNIAEYYAHAPKPIQDMMEKSALVIIDFEKAIENGFVEMSKELSESYYENQ